MSRMLLSVFLVLHGLVHLLYLGQSRKFFELQPGLVWPDGAWTLSKLVGNDVIRSLASFALGLAALGFVAGGVGILVKQEWWRPVILAVAVFSTTVFALFWDGKIQRLDEQGAIGILINIALLAALLGSQWPDFEF